MPLTFCHTLLPGGAVTQELLEGGSLFQMLNAQSKATGQRLFAWHNRWAGLLGMSSHQSLGSGITSAKVAIVLHRIGWLPAHSPGNKGSGTVPALAVWSPLGSPRRAHAVPAADSVLAPRC